MVSLKSLRLRFFAIERKILKNEKEIKDLLCLIHFLLI